MPCFPSLPDDAPVPHIFNAHREIYAPFTRVCQTIMRG